MGGSAAGDHPDKVTRGNRVGGGAAETLPLILPFNTALGKRETAWAHRAVFTANTLHSDITGFHVFSPVKNRFNAQFLGPGYHFLSGDIDGSLNRISQFRGLGRFGRRRFFFFCH